MRIVAHTCSNTEIVCALGRSDWLVGVDDHSDHPPEIVAGLPRIGADLDVDADRVVALEPDLVITSLTVPGHERCVERLRNAGLPLLVTRPHTLTDVADDILRIGEAIEARERARSLAARFEHALDAPPPPGEPVPILIEWWPKPVIVPGKHSWVNEMLALAGGVNPWRDRDAESLQVDADMARAAAPEAVVMSWCGVDEAKYRPHVVRRREGWAGIPAIARDRIVAVSEAWLGRPGPRLIDGIERLRGVVRHVRGA
jgi:iron complex transport system substrate-binding protein